MIKRKDDFWTTIQCQKCMDCYKVLNNKAHGKQTCPYCSESINLEKLNLNVIGPAEMTKPTQDGRLRNILPGGTVWTP